MRVAKLLLDIGDGIALRTYYEGLRSQLGNEQASWLEQWRDLARFILPRHQRFNYIDADRGERLDQSIVDNTATMALRTLTAGLVSGICSPTRTWFEFETSDPELNKRKEVKEYLEEVGRRVRAGLLRSNWYQTQHTVFREEGLYGTSAFQILEDETDDFRCYPWPIGSYFLAGDETNRIDLHMRIVQMTVRQMVAKFGFANCSGGIQNLHTSNAGGAKEQWFPVVNVIHRASYFGEDYAKRNKPWISIWYEMGAYGGNDANKGQAGLLKRAGFDECPVIAPRWDVIGEDFYGTSPGMDCLGDTMGLQLLSMQTTKAIDKMVDPPLMASPSMRNEKISILPGDVTYVDTREQGHGFKPVYQVQFDVEHATSREEQHRRRINEAFYKNLFLMIAESDRRQVTAEEVRAKLEEKMMVLGPVLERNNGENLEPGLWRVLRIMDRKGRLPKPPEILRGKAIRIQFTSLLAQAQRMLGVANIERFMAIVSQEGAVEQGVFDVVDLEETVRQCGDLLAVPAKMIRDQAEVAKRQAAKDAAIQRQQQADAAQKLAGAAANLSKTSTTGPNALADLIHAQTGAAA